MGQAVFSFLSLVKEGLAVVARMRDGGRQGAKREPPATVTARPTACRFGGSPLREVDEVEEESGRTKRMVCVCCSFGASAGVRYGDWLDDNGGRGSLPSRKDVEAMRQF
jgi:hypothetical protein